MGGRNPERGSMCGPFFWVLVLLGVTWGLAAALLKLPEWVFWGVPGGLIGGFYAYCVVMYAWMRFQDRATLRRLRQVSCASCSRVFGTASKVAFKGTPWVDVTCATCGESLVYDPKTLAPRVEAAQE